MKSKQLVKVFNIITDGKFHTLAGIAKKINAPTQSVSARLRDLRKPIYGSNTIERQQRGTVFVYRFID